MARENEALKSKLKIGALQFKKEIFTLEAEISKLMAQNDNLRDCLDLNIDATKLEP